MIKKKISIKCIASGRGQGPPLPGREQPREAAAQAAVVRRRPRQPRRRQAAHVHACHRRRRRERRPGEYTKVFNVDLNHSSLLIFA